MELFIADIAEGSSTGGSIARAWGVLPTNAFKEECVVEEPFKLVECTCTEVCLICQFSIRVAHVE